MGTLSTISGLVYLPASIIAGLLFAVNPALPFVAAAAISGMAILATIFINRR